MWWHRGQNSFHGSIPSRTPWPKLNSGPTFEVSSSTWNMYNLNLAQPGQMAGDATPKLPATSAPSHRLSLSRDRGVLAISPVPTSLSLRWRNLASCLGPSILWMCRGRPRVVREEAAGSLHRRLNLPPRRQLLCMAPGFARVLAMLALSRLRSRNCKAGWCVVGRMRPGDDSGWPSNAN